MAPDLCFASFGLNGPKDSFQLKTLKSLYGLQIHRPRACDMFLSGPTVLNLSLIPLAWSQSKHLLCAHHQAFTYFIVPELHNDSPVFVTEDTGSERL